MSHARYRPSGKFGPQVLVFVPAAIAAAWAIAWVYELALFYIPFIYINAIIVMGFGALMGVMAGAIVKRAHVRNPIVAYSSGVVIALSGLFASFFWNLLRFANEVVEQKPELSKLMVVLQGWPIWLDGRVEGGWKIKSSTMNGAAVWVIWGIEALLVVGFAIWLVREEAHNPYCEGCSKWMATQGGTLPGHDRQSVSLDDLSQLITTPDGALVPDGPQLALVRSYCGSCSEAEYLTVSEVKYSRNKKNELQEHKTRLASNVVLPLEARAKFTARFGAPKPD